MKKRIHNPVRHLRWSFLRKLVINNSWVPSKRGGVPNKSGWGDVGTVGLNK